MRGKERGAGQRPPWRRAEGRAGGGGSWTHKQTLLGHEVPRRIGWSLSASQTQPKLDDWCGLGQGLSTPSFRLGVDHLALPTTNPSFLLCPPSLERRSRLRFIEARHLTSLFPEVFTVPRVSEWVVLVRQRPWNTMLIPSWGNQGNGREGKVGEDRSFTDFDLQ